MVTLNMRGRKRLTLKPNKPNPYTHTDLWTGRDVLKILLQNHRFSVRADEIHFKPSNLHRRAISEHTLFIEKEAAGTKTKEYQAKCPITDNSACSVFWEQYLHQNNSTYHQGRRSRNWFLNQMTIETPILEKCLKGKRVTAWLSCMLISKI